MSASRINRAQFLHRAAALGLLATAGVATATPAEAVRRKLQLKGVVYDTGTGFLGDDGRALWRNSIMRGEIRAIRRRLHANWVSIYGSDVRRLTDTATAALEEGLTVSIQPRSFDEPQADELEKLRKVAVDAERLRRRYDQEVILVIGCEFMLFTPGIVPGANFFERVAYLTRGEFDWPVLQRKFRDFTARMVKVARSNFKGRITYGAASDLELVIPSQYVRNEQEQADHLAAMLDVFTDEGFLGASPYTFVSPDAPHRPHDRAHDEDIAAYSLCKVLRTHDTNPASPYHWLPKESFHSTARFYLTH